jgi:thiamine biosynthesis lipoprotein
MSGLTRFDFDFFAVGSPCTVSLYADGRDAARRIADAAIAETVRIEHRYSRYRADSFLSTINRAAAAGESIRVDDETACLIDHAFIAHEQSDGLFDISSGLLRKIWNDGIECVPEPPEIDAILAKVGLDKIVWRRPELTFRVAGMELDFGGLAKEYAADCAASACRLNGAAYGLVNLGGDVAVFGPHPDESPWRIGIRDPFGGNEAAATLFVPRGGVATSGDYERYFVAGGRRFSHALDPRTGWPIDGLPSVTVAGETCLSAGLTATIALLKGHEAPRWLEATGALHLYIQTAGTLGGSLVAKDGT